MLEYKVIEGFKCYNPEVAFDNDGFSSESFDLLQDAEQNNFWFLGRNRIILYMVEKYTGLKDKFKFLEIGCGNGVVLENLQRNTEYQLYGSDIYVQGLRNASKRLKNVEFIQIDATKFVDENKFDAIGMFDVLEHIEEDKQVLVNTYKSLNPGGCLYITVPQYEFLWSELDNIAFHKRRYTRKEIKAKLQEAGYKIEYLGSFVFFLFPLMIFSRMFLKLKKSSQINGKEEFVTSKVINRVLQFFIYLDEVLISFGIRLPFGGSIICVAKKGYK